MLYIFDKDGTLVGNPGPGRPANHIDEQRLLPGVAEKCAALVTQGHSLAVASNQGGVAFGFISYDQARALVEHAAGLIGARWAHFCPHHPKGSIKKYRGESECRKPRPGMLLDLMAWAGCGPEETVFVGDREEDRLAAEAAGVRFEWAVDFFGWRGD